MLPILLGVIIGILIGWNWPQPPWARDLQTKLSRSIRSLTDQSRH